VAMRMPCASFLSSMSRLDRPGPSKPKAKTQNQN
jgi:hypothetical protein